MEDKILKKIKNGERLNSEDLNSPQNEPPVFSLTEEILNTKIKNDKLEEKIKDSEINFKIGEIMGELTKKLKKQDETIEKIMSELLDKNLEDTKENEITIILPESLHHVIIDKAKLKNISIKQLCLMFIILGLVRDEK